MLSKLLIILLVSYQPYLYSRINNGFYSYSNIYNIQKYGNHTAFKKNGSIYARSGKELIFSGNNYYRINGNYMIKNGKIIGKFKRSGNSLYFYDRNGQHRGTLNDAGFIGDEQHLKYFLFRRK